jgi:FixJ family two-component response regulator
MSQGKPIVFVVDDDASVRASLELLIESAGWQPETFASAQEFLARPCVLAPSCLLLDVNLPDLSGLELQSLLTDRTSMPIIFITGCGDAPLIVRAMKAGAVEFLTKPLVDHVLLAAIQDAINRSNAELSKAMQMRALRDSYASLTGREQEVMALVVAGRLNKQVSCELGITEFTVKAHRGRMMRKMRAVTLPELVMMAARLQLTTVRNSEAAPAPLIPVTCSARRAENHAARFCGPSSLRC